MSDTAREDYLADALAGYVECAIWSEADGFEGAPGGAETINDINPESLAAARLELAGFIAAEADDLGGMDPVQVGHDFWLTRNGHGAGFWDRGLGAAGDRLTGACRPYGESHLVYGDDGWLYFE